MIVVDASALLAIYFREPEEAPFREVLSGTRSTMSAVNHWEVLARAHRVHGPGGAERADRLRELLGVAVSTAAAKDARQAYEAYAQFGKGVGGPLNLGDCFAYALARVEGDGLLFKGEDFPKTDVKPVLA